MSGGGESAPAPAPKAAPAAPVDPVEDLARLVYIQLSANVHGTPGEKPEHLKLVELSFRLAEAFQVGNLKFNTAAIARADGFEIFTHPQRIAVTQHTGVAEATHVA